RAVVVVCTDADAARKRFGVTSGEAGIVYTRTGRRFFNDATFERGILDRLSSALRASGFWTEFGTTWACFDCELMPWSAKAQDLLRSQYAAVGAAGRASLPRAVEALDQAAMRLGSDERELLERIVADFRQREANIGHFVAAYRQ